MLLSDYARCARHGFTDVPRKPRFPSLGPGLSICVVVDNLDLAEGDQWRFDDLQISEAP